jgi:biotin synthase-related radical SAM superfamily protein
MAPSTLAVKTTRTHETAFTNQIPAADTPTNASTSQCPWCSRPSDPNLADRPGNKSEILKAYLLGNVDRWTQPLPLAA